MQNQLRVKQQNIAPFRMYNQTSQSSRHSTLDPSCPQRPSPNKKLARNSSAVSSGENIANRKSNMGAKRPSGIEAKMQNQSQRKILCCARNNCSVERFDLSW